MNTHPNLDLNPELFYLIPPFIEITYGEGGRGCPTILDIIIPIINHPKPLIGPRSIEDDIKTFEDDVK